MGIGTCVIGLSKSGRTTVFNALTAGDADTSGYSKEGAVPHIGVAKVPEPRLKRLADMLHPRKIVPAELTYLDIGASVKGLAKATGISGQSLNQLSNADVFLNVVRAFTNESVPHPKGTVNVERDIGAMDLELTFSDLALMEHRLERIEIALKGAKQPERQSILKEQELLSRIKTNLEKDIPVRELVFSAEEARAIANYQFLTAKPLLVVVNIGEEQLSKRESLEAELGLHYSQSKRRVVAFCGKLDMELAQLDSDAADSFRTDFGLSESGIDRVVKASYELLGLISFFTIASGEVKVWPIPNGTSAVKAAGKIHSDMEKGFIRAEVISLDDLEKCVSLAEARRKGLLRLEGKNYIVQEGDVITFLFNV